jgi:hypothetical protein
MFKSSFDDMGVVSGTIRTAQKILIVSEKLIGNAESSLKG